MSAFRREEKKRLYSSFEDFKNKCLDPIKILTSTEFFIQTEFRGKSKIIFVLKDFKFLASFHEIMFGAQSPILMITKGREIWC